MPTENRSSNTEMVSVPRETIEQAEKLLQEDNRCTMAREFRTILAKPAAQHQGEPVAWRGINELGEIVTEWIDGSPPDRTVDLCGNPDSFAKIELAYTHADPGEVERLHKIAYDTQAALIAANRQIKMLEGELDTLRAQLAEQDALLKRQPSFIRALEQFEADDGTFVRLTDVLGALSASVEPREECAHSYANKLGCPECGEAFASAEPSAPVMQIPEGYCVMPRRLTAENGAKALLLGEFKIEATQECPECRELDEPVEGCEICDGEGEYGQRHIIPWDKIKYIYSEAVKGLALQPNTAR